ncbi:MAG: DUF4886 domain-containing protein, partial [Oscillospiraceae bacterium]|nr:DUF4886 domain-containing protein [Oscillospiraceae bacterium]
MMKRILTFCLALLLIVSALPFAGAAFTDESTISKTYQRAVEAMAEQGVINGFPDGSFGPNKPLTRAQAAKIICVMLEGAEKTEALTKTETGFTDVPASHWAAKYVAYCADKNIVSGVGGGKFDPEGRLSSAAFGKMLLVAYGADASGMIGEDWVNGVKKAAEPTFLTYNMKDFTVRPMPRQEAAQLAFNAWFQGEANADKEKGDPRTMPTGVPETMKLFIIGNSYGNDSTLDYLYQMLKEVGVKDLTIGTLYYSGCHFDQHVDFLLQDSAVYNYYKNTTGKPVTNKEYTFDKAIGDENWTHILMLNGASNNEDYFTPWQDLLIAYVRGKCPDAYLGYNMTWSFRTDGNLRDSHAASLQKLYNGDVVKMYEGIVRLVKTYAEGDGRYKFITHPGTAIVNARSSFIGNGIHRDNMSHLNMGIGRYIAAMTLCCELTGVKPDQIKYLPETLLDNIPD